MTAVELVALIVAAEAPRLPVLLEIDMLATPLDVC